MMMPSSALRCNICPKNPKFSDVSHLLTHVSSKGHLSHYFKLQVRSHQESDAVELLAEYDAWYKQHNIAGLLSDRMHTKESKRGSRNSGSSRSSLPNPQAQRVSDPRKTITPRPVVRTAATPPRNDVPDFMDPRLCQPYNGATAHEDHHRDAPPPPSSRAENYPPIPVPQAQRWAAVDQNQVNWIPHSWNANNARFKAEPESDDDDMSPVAPRRRSYVNQANVVQYSFRRPRRTVLPDPFVDDDPEADADWDMEEEQEDYEPSGMAKLKGILWPGMDIFDAATEQMRRKRNQKKDGSVLKQMEKTSEAVQPTEIIYSPGGTQLKEREITGQVEEDTPLKGETPIPKTKPPRPRRAPLARANPNVFNPRRHSAGQMKGHRRHTMSLEDMSRQTLPLLGNSPADRSYNYFGSGYAPDDADFKLTYGDPTNKRKHGMIIYDDRNDHLQPTRGAKAMAVPSDIGQDRKPYYGPFAGPPAFSQSYPPRASQNGQNQFARPYPVGKENIQPAQNFGNRVDPRVGHAPWANQHPVGQGQFAAQYHHYGAQVQGTFGGFGASDSYGYTSNPLAPFAFSAASGRVETPSSNNNNQDMRSSRGSAAEAKGTREVSPDGTVSDVDGEELGRMYLSTMSG